MGLTEKQKTKIRAFVPIELAGSAATFVTFYNLSDSLEHFAICYGNWAKQETPLVRIHSECITGDLFWSQHCDCGSQLNECTKKFKRKGGILLYLRQEGRGIGLYSKLDAYLLQQKGYDTFSANLALGLPPDKRNYNLAAEMLVSLCRTKIKLITNNPQKVLDLQKNGIEIVEVVSTGTYKTSANEKYLYAKEQYFQGLQI